MAPSSKNKKGRNSAEDTSPFRSRVPKSWSSHSQDGIELKAYIELGFCENFGINDILHKYRQFEGYDRKTLSFSFEAKLSFQYHLSSLDKCILSIDPIDKMYTAILTDILPVGNSVTSDKLRSGEEAIVTHKLALKETYPSLIKVTEMCGFTIDDISVIGLTFGQDLEQMIQKSHDLTIKLNIELADKKN